MSRNCGLCCDSDRTGKMVTSEKSFLVLLSLKGLKLRLNCGFVSGKCCWLHPFLTFHLLGFCKMWTSGSLDCLPAPLCVLSLVLGVVFCHPKVRVLVSGGGLGLGTEVSCILMNAAVIPCISDVPFERSGAVQI